MVPDFFSANHYRSTMCWLKSGNANYGGRFGAPTFKKFPSKHHRSVMISRDNDVRSRMMEAAWRWQNLGFPTLLGGYGIFFIMTKRMFFRACQHSEIQGLVLLLCALHVFLCKILPPHRVAMISDGICATIKVWNFSPVFEWETFGPTTDVRWTKHGFFFSIASWEKPIPSSFKQNRTELLRFFFHPLLRQKTSKNS